MVARHPYLTVKSIHITVRWISYRIDPIGCRILGIKRVVGAHPLVEPQGIKVWGSCSCMANLVSKHFL
jgi:hypothetical protein